MAADTRAQAYLDRLRSDYLFFLKELWHDRQLHRYAPLDWPELELANFIGTGPPRRGALAFRGCGKTTFGTAVLAVNRIFRDPDRRVLIESKSGGEAKKTLALVREWIDRVPFLQHLAPTRDCRDTTTHFDVAGAKENRQPSITALGIDGQLPGNRAHTIIVDDAETPQNTQTVEARSKLASILDENEQILYAPSPDEYLPPSADPAEIIEIGTYHHEESVYLKESNKGFVFITMPLLYPEASEKQLGLAPGVQAKLASGKAQPGDIVFSHRLGREYVADKKARGRRSFMMQQQLVCDLADSNRYPLKLADLLTLDIDPILAPNHVAWGTRDHNGSTALDVPSLGFGSDRLHRPAIIAPDAAPYQSTKAGIDPAGMGDDMIGYAAAGTLNATLYYKSVLEFAGGYSTDTLEQIARQLRRDRATELYVESNYGGGMFETLLEPVLRRYFVAPGQSDDKGVHYPDGWACAIVRDTKITHVTGQKESRILDTLEPLASTHRIAINTASASRPSFQERWTRLTRERNCLPHLHDLDAMVMVARGHLHAVGHDQQALAALTRQRQDADAHDAFRKKYGMKPRRDLTFYRFK